MFKKDSYGNPIDSNGTVYGTSDGKPPVTGQPVKVYDGWGGSKDGTWNNGKAETNKSSY